MEFCQLLEAFAKAAGITETITPDDDGIVRIGYDADRYLKFVEHPEKRMLGVHTVIGEPPAEGREELYDLLLRTMYLGDGTQGAEFSLDDEGKVVLQRTLDLRYLDLAEFKAALEGFVNVLELWRTTVADFRPAVTTEGPVEAAPGLGGFMQV